MCEKYFLALISVQQREELVENKKKVVSYIWSTMNLIQTSLSSINSN